LDDAFERADGDGFVPVHGHDDLPPVGMTPFQVTALLSYQSEAVFPQNCDHLLSGADWKAPAQGRASSTILAPLESSTGEGSNQSANASLALATASSSESPALAQPGSSGKNGRPTFGFGVKLDEQAQFHAHRITSSC